MAKAPKKASVVERAMGTADTVAALREELGDQALAGLAHREEVYTPVVLTARFPWGGVEFLPGPMKVSAELLAAMQKAGVLAEPES